MLKTNLQNLCCVMSLRSPCTSYKYKVLYVNLCPDLYAKSNTVIQSVFIVLVVKEKESGEGKRGGLLNKFIAPKRGII